jgi:tetratricopeptide (TPR) repeat protein
MSTQDETLHEVLDFAPDNPQYLRLLREQLASRPGVIPFVGAGLSVPFGYESWTAFLLEQAAAAGITEAINSLIEKGDYEEAGERVREGRGSVTFDTALEAEYSVSKLKGQSLTEGAAARLPLMFDGPVVTTNFDHVLETVFEAAGRHFVQVAWGANVTQTDKAFREGRHVLLKIHGDVEEVSDRVFTKSEYAIHYTDQSPGSLSALVLFMLTAHRLLFLGCSLAPDRTMEILYNAQPARSGVRHYAIVEAPSDEPARLQRHKYLGDRGILPIWYPHGDHRLVGSLLISLLEGMPRERRPPSPARKAPARLSGPHDPRLLHPSGWYGRTREVKALFAFLHKRDGASPEIFSVEGAPGIGKTEVCKEALRRYLKLPESQPAYYVDLSGVINEAALLDRLGTSLGASETGSLEQILAAVESAPGVVYLDNLEDVLEYDTAVNSLRLLAAMPKNRVLVSSRRRVSDGDLQVRHFRINKLGATDAVRLFTAQWRGSGNEDPVRESDERVRAFVTEELSCHALSIVLVAAQGWRFGSFTLLREAWREQSLRLAESEGKRSEGAGRLGSLNKSLELSATAVRTSMPVAGMLWGLMVFFPAGLSRSAWRVISQEGPAWEESRTGLLLFHLIEVDQQGTLTMLAPIRQFVLSWIPGGTDGLFMKEVAKRAFNYFSTLAQRASTQEQAADRTAGIAALVAEFPNLHRFLLITTKYTEEWPEFLSGLSADIANYYQYRPVLANGILEALLEQQRRAGLSEAAAFTGYLWGTVKDNLGQQNEARKLYGSSLESYRALGSEVGMATVLQGMGDLEKDSGNLDNARASYEKAQAIYEKEGEPTGLGNILQRLGDLYVLIGEYDKAQPLYMRAILLFVSAGNQLGAANALRSQGDVLRLQGIAPMAVQNYEQALDLFLSEGDELGAANTYYSLGEIYFGQQDWATANQHYLAARDRYATVGTPLGLAKAYAQLAHVANALGESRSRDSYLRQAAAAAAASHVPAIVRLVEKAKFEIGGQ